MEETERTKPGSTRVQTSILSGLEKPALIWMASRLPRWIGPDLLTGIGVFAMAFVGLCYYLASFNALWLLGASAGLIVNWFGDSLDGTVARVRNRQRPRYGYYLDHLVDAFGTSFVMFGLAFSGLINPMLAAVVLAVYLILSINAYLAAHTVGVFRISFGRVSPTEGRVVLILLNTLLIFRQEFSLFSRTLRIMDVLAILVALGLFALILLAAVPNLRKLNREETAQLEQQEGGDSGA